MENYLLAIQIVSLLLPGVVTLVKAIEAPGNGAQKAQVILDFVSANLELLPADVRAKIPADKIKAVVGLVTSLLVTYLNARGIFQTGQPAATAPAGPALPVATPAAPAPTPAPPTKEDEIEDLEGQIAHQRARLVNTTHPGYVGNDAEKRKKIEERISRNEQRLRELKGGG